MKVEGKEYRQYRNKNVTIEYLHSEMRLMEMKDAEFLWSTYEEENPILPYLTFANQKITDSALETCKHIHDVQQNISQFLEMYVLTSDGIFELLKLYSRMSISKFKGGIVFRKESAVYDSQIKRILGNTDLMRGNIYRRILLELNQRAILHDKSKLSENEKPYFDAFSTVLNEREYGTPSHTEILQLIKPAIEHHYKHNSHHPEYYENGINGMNLFDVIEMFCDWAAACKQNKNGNFTQSILRGKERFGMSDQLTQLMLETKDVLGW